MRCLSCNKEMKLIVGKQNPRKAHCYGCWYEKSNAASLTYRDYYYCKDCDKSVKATVNLRVECENSSVEMETWNVAGFVMGD